jgi:DivIVA domain-containing protein
MAEDPPQDAGDTRETRPRRQRRRSEADAVRAKDFPQAMRGYDRAAVDAWRSDMAKLVERLEEQAPRDAAVKRALDEVGKETSSILQRAHEAADDIASRSRSQAEGRLARAEREAEITVSEAENRVRELDEDYRRIWDERSRLLEEMRQLADDVLGVSDDAAERIQGPREPEPITTETEVPEAAPAPSMDEPTVVTPPAPDRPNGSSGGASAD